uniref:Helitron helicase-like domain-containing protein n=1 Tax=Lactuca sativa TaxID=4236 RepID=A0A9R1VGS8_LACSA|nr:hypothetical protein LSAT_V11C500251650 [Lactuca sativa]
MEGSSSETSKSVKGKHKCKKGRELLKFIPSVADRLRNVANCCYCGAIKFYSKTNYIWLRWFYLDKALAKRNKGISTFRNDSSKSLPLYFHNTEHEIENHISTCPCLSEDLIGKCVKYLDQNPYARFFRYLRDVPVLDNYKIILKTIHGQDQRVSQVATIWINGEDNEDYGTRSIEVKTHNNESKSVQYYFGCYDPLHYPLMFPFGELGWHQAKKSYNPKFVSVREYYAYKLEISPRDKSCFMKNAREVIHHHSQIL